MREIVRILRWEYWTDKSFFGDLSKKWNVKLSANDIFNTTKILFTIFSGMNDVYIEKAASVRAVECIVRYKFNTVKTKYKGKGQGKRK